MERAKPATFADFMDGLSRAMDLPVAPAAPAHRVTLPAAPAQAALAAELDAEVAAMYEAGDLHGDDTPSTSTRRRGRELTVNLRRAAESEAA